jgi:predicted NUDIX family NTP pyrophosphohydrolase
VCVCARARCVCVCGVCVDGCKQSKGKENKSGGGVVYTYTS